MGATLSSQVKIESPDDIRRLIIKEGWSLGKVKIHGNIYWRLQKYVPGKKSPIQIMVPKDLKKHAEQIYEEIKKQLQKEKMERELREIGKVESSEKTIEKLALKEKVERTKPIKARLIENLAWYSNLVQDIGKFTVFHLLDSGLVALDENDYDDYERARDKFYDALQVLVEAKENAIRLRELEEDYRLLQADHEFLLKVYKKLQEVYNLAAASMCKECKQRFILNLALKEVVGVG